MSKGIELLQKAIGTNIERTVAEVLFYGEEMLGSIANIAIELEDGRRFFLGCAGDGGIFVVSSSKKPRGPAPGFTHVSRRIAELAGSLSLLDADATSLRLAIGGHVLGVRNDDDELWVTVDDEPLPEGMLIR